MHINPDAIVQTIRRVGVVNTRITPGSGDKVQIEVNEGGSWRVLQENINPGTAHNLIAQAGRNVILG